MLGASDPHTPGVSRGVVSSTPSGTPVRRDENTSLCSASPVAISTTPPSPAVAAGTTLGDQQLSTLNFFEGDVTSDMRATASALSRSPASSQRGTLSISPSRSHPQHPHHSTSASTVTSPRNSAIHSGAAPVTSATKGRKGKEQQVEESAGEPCSTPRTETKHRPRHHTKEERTPDQKTKGKEERKAASRNLSHGKRDLNPHPATMRSRSPASSVSASTSQARRELPSPSNSGRRHSGTERRKKEKEKGEKSVRKTRKKRDTAARKDTSVEVVANRQLAPEKSSSSSSSSPKVLPTPAIRASTTEMVRHRPGSPQRTSTSPSLGRTSSQPCPPSHARESVPRFHAVRSSSAASSRQVESPLPGSARTPRRRSDDETDASASSSSSIFDGSTGRESRRCKDRHRHRHPRSMEGVLREEEVEAAASIDALWRSDSDVAIRPRRRPSVEWRTTRMEAVRDRNAVRFIEPQNSATYVAKSSFCAQNPFRTQTLADFTIDPDYSTPAHIKEYKAVSTSAGVEGLRAVKVNSIQALKDRFKHAACTPYMPVGKGTLDEMIMYLCAGEWFMRWHWTHCADPKKYKRRYFWLDGERCSLMWALSESIVSFSQLKLRSVERMVSDCVSVNGKVIFRMQLYGEKILVFGTEHRLLFDQWFSVLRYIISPNNGHGVPGLWQRPSHSTVTRVGRWASRYSPLQAELLNDIQFKSKKNTGWTE